MRARGLRAAAAGLVIASVLGGCAWLGLVDTPDSLMQEGQQLYLDKRYDEAIVKFERVIELDNTRWLAYLYLARCYMAKGSWTRAVTNARLAYQAQPGGEDVVPVFSQSLWGAGTEALGGGKFGDAISAFREYLRVKPADAAAYVALGKSFLGAGDRTEALAAFGRALQLNPTHTEANDLVRGLR